MKRAEQKIARAVTGEDTAGPVAPMRGRGQTDDQQPGIRVPEAWNRLSPVRQVTEGPSSDSGDPAAEFPQTGTTGAGDQIVVDTHQIFSHRIFTQQESRYPLYLTFLDQAKPDLLFDIMD
jgi:hypothetical protein